MHARLARSIAEHISLNVIIYLSTSLIMYSVSTVRQ